MAPARLLLFQALILGAAGCDPLYGGDEEGLLCDRARAVSAQVRERSAPCQERVLELESGLRCAEGYSSCSTHEVEQLNAALGCFGDIAPCSSATEARWSAEFEACLGQWKYAQALHTCDAHRAW